jgi:hypothetical protein
MPAKWSRPVFSFRFYEDKISRALRIGGLCGRHEAAEEGNPLPCPQKMDHDDPQETGENMTRFKIATRAGCPGDLPPPSPPAEKASTCEDQAGLPGIPECRRL